MQFSPKILVIWSFPKLFLISTEISTSCEGTWLNFDLTVTHCRPDCVWINENVRGKFETNGLFKILADFLSCNTQATQVNTSSSLPMEKCCFLSPPSALLLDPPTPLPSPHILARVLTSANQSQGLRVRTNQGQARGQWGCKQETGVQCVTLLSVRYV